VAYRHLVSELVSRDIKVRYRVVSASRGRGSASPQHGGLHVCIALILRRESRAIRCTS